MNRQASEATSINSAALSTDQTTQSGDPSRDLLGEGAKDDEQLVSRSWSELLEESTFSVLFAMCKHSTASRKLSILGIFIDFFQLLAFVFSKNFQWSSVVSPLQRFLGMFGVTNTSHPYLWYMLILWGSMAATTGAVVNIIFVAITFGRSEFTTGSIWMIKTLQTLVSLFLTVLYLPFMTIFMSLVHCSEEKSTGRYILSSVEDTTIECWTVPHIIYVIICAPIFLCFLLFSLSFVAVYYDSNPESDHIMARVHARVDLASLLLKTLIVGCFVFLSDQEWILILILALWALTTYSLTWLYMPYYRKSVNLLRCRLFFIVFYGVICLSFNVAAGGIVKDVIGWVFLAGALPVGFVGGRLAERRATALLEIYASNYTINMTVSGQKVSRLRATSMLVQQASNQESSRINMRPSLVHQLMTYISLPTDIPLVAKIICDPIEKKKKRQETYPRELLEKCDQIFAEGVEMYPESFLLQMCYINFLFFMSKQIDKFRIQAKLLNDTSPPFDVRFMVYRRNKELFQQRQSDNVGSMTMDLVSYIEFQTNYKAARKYHANALRSIRQFWILLMADDKLDIELLPRAAKHITEATASAQHYYETLLRRHSDSPRLYRAYAEFLIGAAHDARKANLFLKKADELEDQMTRKRTEERQRSGLAQNIGGTIDMDDKTKAVITINSTGIIQSVNHTVTKLLQYGKSEIIGLNVSAIMPSPYSENHNTYLENYLRTGVKKVIGSVRSLDAKKKNGELFPVRLAVHQADVNGQIFFVGVLEKQEDTASVVTVSPEGVILSCNQLITQKMGFTGKDMTNQNFGYFFSESPDCLPSLINFDTMYGNIESTRLWAKHASGRNAEVVMSPKKIAKDNTVHFRCIFEFLDEIEVMLSIDEEGRIQSSNHFVKHIFGYNREELIGQDVTILMPPPYLAFHATYLKNYLMTGTKHVIGMNRTVEGKHKDGSTFKINLLVSEGEVAGKRLFSSRIVFSKRTELTNCRLTLTETGVVHSVSESASKIFGDGPLLGASFERMFAFTSDSLVELPFVSAIKKRCGQGPTSCLAINMTNDPNTPICCSAEFIEQELNGVVYFIAKIHSVDDADALVYCNPLGIVHKWNEPFHYLVSQPKHSLNTMKLADFLQHPESASAEGVNASTDAANKVELAKILNNRITLLIAHADGSTLAVNTECCTTTFPLGFACRFTRKPMPLPLRLASSKSPNMGVAIDSRGNSAAGSSRDFSNGSARDAGEIDIFLPVPTNIPLKQKKRVQIGFSDSAGDGIEVVPTESKTSEEHTESILSDSNQTIRRIQRIRQKYQMNSGESPILIQLQKKVTYVMGALGLMAIGLLIALSVLSERGKMNTHVIGLCGATVTYHHSVYLLVQSMTSPCLSEDKCLWSDFDVSAQLGDDTNMLEQSMMALYLLDNIQDLYDDAKHYTFYSDALPSFLSSSIQPLSVAAGTSQNYFEHSRIFLKDIINGRTLTSQRSFIEAMRTYIYYAKRLSQRKTLPLSLDDRMVYYVTHNGPGALLETLESVCDDFYDHLTGDNTVLTFVQGFIMVLAVLIILILALAILRPSFDDVHLERKRALSLFLLVPKSVVRILARTRISLDSSDSDSGDSDNDEPQEKQIDSAVRSMEDGVHPKGVALRRQSQTRPKQEESAAPSNQASSSRNEKRSLKMNLLKNIHSTIKTRMNKRNEAGAYGEGERPAAEMNNFLRAPKGKKKADEADEDQEDEYIPPTSLFTELLLQIKFYILSVTVNLHPVTKRWVSLLIVLFIWFTVATVFGISTSNSGADASSLIYYTTKLASAGEHLSYAALMYYGTRGNATEKVILENSVADFKKLLNCVVYGCLSLDIVRSDADPELSSLYYANRCYLKNAIECPDQDDQLYMLSKTGLVNIATEINRAATNLLRKDANEELSFRDSDFLTIYRGERILMRKGVLMGSFMHHDQVQEHYKLLLIGQGAILGLTSGFILISLVVVFRPMFRSLQEENRQTKAMLLMMPDEVVANTKEIERFLVESCDNDAID
eukprot:TRINITY_DN8189_c0_g1_i13.p1 TRINITY_DN8189_c0_g1~~TRINITY_DN8189_c0_g1_i13.p1  ORF type:complete len:2011 (-),score=323.31 TRINITY_DN8189_c0_g1_i13:314-6346(-)